MRGTAGRTRLPQTPSRFIPARAGNGSHFQIRNSRPPVHPRACGERWFICHGFSLLVGSSPRVRGTARLDRSRLIKIRFIPARAGNGKSMSSRTSMTTVHPRACGERCGDKLAERLDYGSFPRVRGTVRPLASWCACRGFIPARAGNGGLPPAMQFLLPVHPRACGERRCCT